MAYKGFFKSPLFKNSNANPSFQRIVPLNSGTPLSAFAGFNFSNGSSAPNAIYPVFEMYSATASNASAAGVFSWRVDDAFETGNQAICLFVAGRYNVTTGAASNATTRPLYRFAKGDESSVFDISALGSMRFGPGGAASIKHHFVGENSGAHQTVVRIGGDSLAAAVGIEIGSQNLASGAGALALASAQGTSGNVFRFGYNGISGGLPGVSVGSYDGTGSWAFGKATGSEHTFSGRNKFASGGVERFWIDASLSPGLRADSTILPPGAGTNTVKWNNGNGDFTFDASSRLVKDKITPLNPMIESVKLLKPCIYERTDSGNVLEIGLIADEVAEILPELVSMGQKKILTGKKDDTEMIPVSVDYGRMSSVLIKAIQEQQAQIEDLRAQIATLQGAQPAPAAKTTTTTTRKR
ncbi:MAG: tail fiber domain-containing protein [Luteolibacter sp.]